MIEVKGVSHRFGERTILRNVSLSVAPREIVVIMGSSGGGKTTLLKCICGLLKPSEGEITVDGVSVVKTPEKAREKMGLVFQYAALFDYLTVEENIMFGAERRKRIGAAEKRRLTAELLDQVHLKGVEKLLPSELSGGMRKRVGLARALAVEPKVILYDEPTSGLDPVTAYAIDELIVETRDQRKATSLVVSHDVSSVLRVADRIAFLHLGELVFLGSPAEFREASHGPIRELVEKARAEAFTASEEPS
jgi:phospholipid/cholesterol/gamma-HCH transport system ATP-binding protein